ncbi:MAG: DivIVA domain-containing protein, partial [Gemmatimonadaceae bacterium]
MIDEGFHLTALDVRRYDFGSKLRGADPAKVEEFRSQVAEEIERLTRLSQEMESKARGFHEQLRAFRDRDKALNDALISAQQLRSEIREQAERESQLILREARAEGEKIVEAARGEVRRIEMELAGLEKSRRSFIGQLRALAERHLSDLAASESAPPSRLGGVG